jgi:hypothetical protein
MKLSLQLLRLPVRTLTLLFLLLFSGANNYAQELYFAKKNHDFGLIELRDTIEFEFWYVNTGTAEAKIVKAETDCACTHSGGVGKELKPGEGTGFKAIFVPYHIGSFQKKFELTDNTGKKITLTLRGEICEKITPEKIYPYIMPPLRSKTKIFSFGALTTQMPVTKKFELYNPTEKDFVMDGRFDTPAHIRVLFDSTHVIKAKSSASLYVVYDAAVKNDFGFVTDSIAIFSTDTVIRPIVSASIEAYFPEMTDSELRKAPAFHTSKTDINLGSFVKKDTIFADFDVTNKGGKNLQIHKMLFSYGAGIASTSEHEKPIPPGGTRRYKIWIAKTGKSPKLATVRSLSLITNDPKRHVVTLKFRVNMK